MPRDIEKLKEELKKSIMFSADDEFFGLAESLKDILKIDSASGPIFPDKGKKLNDPEKILLYLLEKRIGWKLGILNDDETTTDEISSRAFISTGTVSARTSELTRNGYVINISGSKGRKVAKYKITDAGVHQFKDNILKKLIGSEKNGK